MLYGYTQTLFCSDSVAHTPPGDWYHNGKKLDVYSRNYTIANAAFNDDGEYQCRRNGTNVYSTHLKVYGKSWYIHPHCLAKCLNVSTCIHIPITRVIETVHARTHTHTHTSTCAPMQKPSHIICAKKSQAYDMKKSIYL